jgi:hypothetical protein
MRKAASVVPVSLRVAALDVFFVLVVAVVLAGFILADCVCVDAFERLAGATRSRLDREDNLSEYECEWERGDELEPADSCSHD